MAAAATESVRAVEPDDLVIIKVRISSSTMHRMVGSVAVNLAHHVPAPVTAVP